VGIAENVQAIEERLALACARVGRPRDSVTLVAASKNFPAEAVAEAYRSGVAVFGENRLQEAGPKIAAAASLGAKPAWHLIGSLQRNKVRAALALFDMIQSVDSLALAREIGRRAERPVAVLLEVNVSGEQSKHGFSLAELPEALEVARAIGNLDVRGLMTVPPPGGPEVSRPHFRALAGVAEQLGLRELSMGMTDDFEAAIEEGATIVRVGRAIFGERTLR
jgi:pyridoxal phosphate enzyme (YggS family)